MPVDRFVDVQSIPQTQCPVPSWEWKRSELVSKREKEKEERERERERKREATDGSDVCAIWAPAHVQDPALVSFEARHLTGMMRVLLKTH